MKTEFWLFKATIIKKNFTCIIVVSSMVEESTRVSKQITPKKSTRENK